MTEDTPLPGDLLLLNGELARILNKNNLVATVLSVDTWSDHGPLSTENHGSLEVMFSDGEFEGFVVYGWRATWKRLNE